MYEGLQDIASAWRTIVHVSEWSGLSIGALAAGAGLVYLRPALLKPVIAAGVVVGLCWICVIHGDRVGRADVEAQWADARKAAIETEAERKIMIEQQVDLRYQPMLAELKQQSDERKARADANERKLAVLSKGAPARNACELGAAADRVPGRRQARQLPAR
jgi:hypothetical protein